MTIGPLVPTKGKWGFGLALCLGLRLLGFGAQPFEFGAKLLRLWALLVRLGALLLRLGALLLRLGALLLRLGAVSGDENDEDSRIPNPTKGPIGPN